MVECGFIGCPNEATAAPRFVLYFTDGVQEWPIPAILGMQVCEACRVRVTQENAISQEVIDSIAAMRPGARFTSSALEWVPFTHPEYVDMKKRSPN